MYPRKCYKFLKSHLDKKQITVITGMRRTGKTTLVKKLLEDVKSKNKIYIDLERIDNRELFSGKNYDAVLYMLRQRGMDISRKIYVALDEIQLVPNIPSILKYLYDNNNIKFIITGSSSYYIKNLFTESLAGRKKVFELFPLDFGEFLTFKEIPHIVEPFSGKKFNITEFERLKELYDEFIEYGGFPEVVLTGKINEKKDLLEDIISSYINIDVKTLTDFRNQDNLYKLMKMLAARSGTRLDYTKLSSLTGLSRVTVQNYVDFLEKTYIICRIPILTRNPDREIVKAKKLHFYDNGIMNMLADVSGGSKFENSIFVQLHQKGALCYYALRNGKEIDFILEKKTAFEAKESPMKTDMKNLKKLSGLAKIKKGRLIGRNRVPGFLDYVWGGEIK